MCLCWHTIQLKCASSYPMMNSFLSTCSQLHQPRIYMHFFSQTKHIHQVRINITIIISRVNKNRGNFIINLTIHLNNILLVIFLPIIQCCIDLRNDLSNIPNYLCFMFVVDLRPTTLIRWEILLDMLLAIYPTLQLSFTLTFVFFPSRL